MTFVASDPLSELVWSPHKGLSLRCAAGSASGRNPSLVWGAGPSTMALTPPPGSTPGTNCEKLVRDGDLISPPPLAMPPIKDNAILPCAVECCTGMAQTGCPDLGHDSGFCNKAKCMEARVDAQSIAQEKGDIKLEDYTCESENQTATSQGMKEPKLSCFPVPEEVGVVEDKSAPDVATVTLMPGVVIGVQLSDPMHQNGKNGESQQTAGAELRGPLQCQASCNLMLNIPPPDHGREPDIIMKEQSKSKTALPASHSAFSRGKLESTAENDLAPSCNMFLDSAVGFQDASKSKKLHRPDVYVASEASPIRAYACHRKGKEKVLPGIDYDRTMAKDMGDSHESVESCNSGAFSSARKKRILSFEQQLITGSRRVKQKVQGHPASTSVTKVDSSFTNWICNMVKGLPKPTEVKTSFVLANPEDSNVTQGLTTCSRGQDPDWSNTGFRFFFQSLYRPNQKVQHQKMLDFGKWTSEGCEQLELFKRHQDASCIPLSSGADDPEPGECNFLPPIRVNQPVVASVDCGSIHKQTIDENVAALKPDSLENGNPSKQASDLAKERGSSHSSTFVEHKTLSGNDAPIYLGADYPEAGDFDLLPTPRFNQIALGDGEDALADRRTPYENAATVQLDSQTPSVHRCSSKQASDVAKEGWSSHGPCLGKRETLTGYSASDPQSETRVAYSLVNKSGPLSSLWVTRFCPKISGSTVIMPHKRSTGGDVGCSADNIDSSRVGESLAHQECPSEYPSGATDQDLQDCAADKDAGPGLKRIEGHKLDLVMPSLRFKSGEAVSSVLAKRLDALKQILPSDLTGRTSEVIATCLFCGVRGHNLRECSQITETELEELLNNVSGYGGAEESLCLCIICFQLNHWAAACPNALSRKQHGIENAASLHNHHIASEMRTEREFRRDLTLLENVDSKTQVVREHAVANTTSYKRRRLSSIADLEMNRLVSAQNPHLVNEFTCADYGESISIVPKYPHPGTGISMQMSDVPRGVFEAVKKLRLSRMDILKWMKCSESVSSLDGYYLRVRLARWEKRLGATGYYVACITGIGEERSEEILKKRIRVDVGGVQCFIGSQYVSNRDFLEDEVMAWWSATSKCGGNIPSEEDLRVKVKERLRLGL